MNHALGVTVALALAGLGCIRNPANPTPAPDPTPVCTPSCRGQACGAPDGCGGTCRHGRCPTGQVCGGGGVPNQCACVPSCAGKACGAPDGCGGACPTGSCPAGQFCGAGGVPGACGGAPIGQGVECFVFDDGYTNLAGPSGAVLVRGPRQACIPDAGNGTCRKWFGRCRTTDASHQPVFFRAFAGAFTSVTAASDAVYLNDAYEMCIPDQGNGTCRTWAGRATLQTGASVQCRLFDDGETRLTGLTAGFAMQGSPFGELATGRLCQYEGATQGFGLDGTCRKWFGRCLVAGCGDGVCSPGESPWSCPADCRCGDGVCSPGENARTCPADCPTRCGDGVCTGGESNASCPGDCPPRCGDGVCSAGETNATCPRDCPPPATPTTCSGAAATSTATIYAVGVVDVHGCYVNLVLPFASSQGEADGCVQQNLLPGFAIVSAPTQLVQATYHTEPTYGCAEQDFAAFSDAGAQSCATHAGYGFPGHCPR